MSVKPYFQSENTYNVKPDELEAPVEPDELEVPVKPDKLEVPLPTSKVPQELTEPTKSAIKCG
jgi:hypothetical protein